MDKVQLKVDSKIQIQINSSVADEAVGAGIF